jgi:hypothetical protein
MDARKMKPSELYFTLYYAHFHVKYVFFETFDYKIRSSVSVMQMNMN